MGVGCGVGAAEGFKDGAGDGAKVGAKLSVGGSVGLGERVGDGVQFLGRGDGLGVGRGVGSVGGVWGRGVGASVCAWAVMRSMTVRSRRMARRGGGGAGRGARARVRCLVYAARACGRFDRVGCPISAQFALCWELPNSGQQRLILLIWRFHCGGAANTARQAHYKRPRTAAAARPGHERTPQHHAHDTAPAPIKAP